MKLLRATILAAAVTFGLPVWANECEGWNTDGFFKAVSANDVTSCLSAGADVNARTESGYTPLHMAAAFNDNPAVLEVLLAAGADVNARTESGWTPLHMAAWVNLTPAVFEVLLAAGADPTALTEDGRLPFNLAGENPAIKGSKVYWMLNDALFK